eukprot:m.180164 g.180164  ORF g.180164 m.180164 type:complete len:634 (+) comp14943_c0_seq1:174-2075(+)
MFVVCTTLCAATAAATVSHASMAPGGPSPPSVDDAVPLLFFDWAASTTSHDPSLTLEVNRPYKGERVIAPTEPWESWAVFAYTSVVQVGPGQYRMYYDCIQGSGVPPGDAATGRASKATEGQEEVGLGDGEGDAMYSARRICLATSTDGLNWIKPNLGLYNLNGSTANNILVDDSGNSVFLDTNPSADPQAKWKMACSTSVWGSPDGLKWTKLSNHTPVKAEDDTKPTAGYDPTLGKYVIYVRRDVGGRKIGRCETTDFLNWESESPGGCPVVFETDALDPANLDVYTNAWTPYPSASTPAGHFFFPSFYHHFSSGAPFGFGNDGLLDIRMVVSSNGTNLKYVPGNGNRAPFVPLGINACGAGTTSPSVTGGWCSPDTGIEAKTAFDTSAMYMASGYVTSVDGNEIYLYSSGQPFTHGGDAGKQLWGNNTGMRVLRLRKDGFTSVVAPYVPNLSPDALPALVTTSLTVPTECPKPHVISNTTSCSYAYPGGKCPPSSPTVPCQTDADCHAVAPSDPNLTCRGKVVTCTANHTCGNGEPSGELCVGHTSTGGASIGLNIETSVAGYALVEVQQNGVPVPGMTLNDSVPIRGSAIGATPMWHSGSLNNLAGQEITLKIAMADARLFAVRIGCSSQ